MKYLKSYNESIKHLLKPKNQENILKELEKLSDSDRIRAIIKYQLPYDILPDNLTINGNLYCYDSQITKLPDNLTVKGDLYCDNNQLTELPDNLIVKGNLWCSNNQLIELPDNLIVIGYLDCRNNKLPKHTQKPKGVKGEMHL